jgi:hypothetical protein
VEARAKLVRDLDFMGLRGLGIFKKSVDQRTNVPVRYKV